MRIRKERAFVFLPVLNKQNSSVSGALKATTTLNDLVILNHFHPPNNDDIDYRLPVFAGGNRTENNDAMPCYFHFRGKALRQVS